VHLRSYSTPVCVANGSFPHFFRASQKETSSADLYSSSTLGTGHAETHKAMRAKEEDSLVRQLLPGTGITEDGLQTQEVGSALQRDSDGNVPQHVVKKRKKKQKNNVGVALSLTRV
jgi:hypothetical protein